MGMEKEQKIERMEARGHLRAVMYSTGALKGMVYILFFYLFWVIAVHDMLTESWVVYSKILSLDS